jgi:two-component system, NtrC family, response regulator AtoC
MLSAKILIVEDEQITATDIEDTLAGLGYEVVGVAANAAEAYDIARKRKPQLALMDIRLKGEVDGIDAARKLREQFGTPSIFLTAHADERTLDRAGGAEPLGYIVKPFHAPELQAAIQMALHKRGRDHERSRRAHDVAATLEALGVGVIRTDELGRVIYLNDAAERWTGWASSEAQGLRLAEVFRLLDADSAASLEEFTMTAMRERHVVHLPRGAKLRARDGIERAVAGNFAPVRDDAGRMMGAAIAFDKPVEAGAEQAAVKQARGLQSPTDEGDMIVESKAMRDLMSFARRVAASGVSTILLQGESGVGKDVVAKFLHANSRRADQPFITLNCAAIPDTLLESEVFGYEKGAFTDARAQKKGVLDLADGGTVFLDEIGELQSHLQSKLLRVLEDQTFRRLGGVRDITVDLRIITATNRNLAEAVRQKEFREDLYYRLNVITISIPPLRERREDILPLVDMFVRRYNDRFERNIRGVTAEAERMLAEHHWPGNVREVRNVIERAMVLEDDNLLSAGSIMLGVGELSPAPELALAVAAGDASLEDVERAMLVQALDRCQGNQTRAAKALGVSRDTLRYRIKKYQLH